MKKFIVGILLAAGILALLLRRVDVRQLAEALLAVRPGYLLAALAIKFAIMYLKAVRWAVAIEGATGERPRRRVFSACMIGFAGNVVMPARLGEIGRVMVLCKHNPVARSLALTSVAVTQLLDLLVLGLFFFAVSFWAAGAALVDRAVLVALIAALVALLAALALFQWRLEWVRAAFVRFARRLPSAFGKRLSDYLEHFAAGLRAIRRPVFLAAMLACTLVVWTAEIAAVGLALAAFKLPVTLLMAAVVTLALNLSFAIPVTPGNVGTHQLLCVLVLGLFGVSEVQALAYSIGMQGAVNISIALCGTLLFYREGMSLGSLRHPPAHARQGNAECGMQKAKADR